MASVKVNRFSFHHDIEIKSIWPQMVGDIGEVWTLPMLGGWRSSGSFQPFVVVLGPQPALCRSDTAPKHKDLLPLEEIPVSSYIRIKIST